MSTQPHPAHIYYMFQDFLARVAAGRKMSVEEVRQLAKGRVYSGRQAKEVGGPPYDTQCFCSSLLCVINRATRRA